MLAEFARSLTVRGRLIGPERERDQHQKGADEKIKIPIQVWREHELPTRGYQNE